MADNDIGQKIDSLYQAFMYKRYKHVPRNCSQLPEGPLQRISLHNDTVLHMAAHSKKKDLVLRLLNMLPEDINHRLADIKNNKGNTILHEVATSDTMIDVAEELLKRNADLLIKSNDLGEKPIFCAARYGQTEMFRSLASEIENRRQSEEERKADLRRNDGTTVLHISIASECFDLALSIVCLYPYLIEERDQFSMTAFQSIACNTTIFQKGRTQKRRGFIELLSKSNIDPEEQRNIEEDQRSKKSILKGKFMAALPILCKIMCQEKMCSKAQCWEAQCWDGERIRDERELLKVLISNLVEKDTSWDASINFQAMSLGESEKESEIEEHSSKLSQKKEGQNSQESSTSKYKKSDESPLFLATISNITEIICMILKFKPEALMRTNNEGMNILQVAILYRHIDIYDMVVKYEVLARRLLSAVDEEGNSMQHLVGQKRKSQTIEKMQNPALQLRDELLLFEKVRSDSKMLVSNPLNKDNKTAEELFAASNERLHQQAKEWLMRTTENCTIVSVFIATVAFAAAYTVPGGPNQDTGIPILNSKPFFVVFIIADVISLTLALTSVGIFLSILTSSFPLEDFKKYLFDKLKQGIICLVLSVSMMAVAFGATIILIMKHNGKNVVWDVVAFLPVPIFFLSYSPIRSAVLRPCRERLITYVAIAVVVFLYVVAIFFFLLPYVAFKGLRWTLEKACTFICKPVARISWKKSQPQSYTQSPQPPVAPPQV